MPKARAGVYAVEHIASHRLYIGSSANLASRWYQHQRALRAGIHQAAHLQNAWNKYGSGAFEFFVIEECAPVREVLLAREQEYLDAFHPVFNNCITAGSRRGSHNTDNSRVRDAARRRSARTTQCPRGHEYTTENTYLTKRNQRICLRCAAEKTSARYVPKTVRRDGPTCKRGHAWTPENTITLKTGTRQCRACAALRRQTRNARTRERYRSDPELRDRRRAEYMRHREARLVSMSAYRQAHKT